MKTITIKDDVYNMLVAIKKEKSFSEIIRELIKKDVKKRGEIIIEICKFFGKPSDVFIETLKRGVKVEDITRYLLPNKTEERKQKSD